MGKRIDLSGEKFGCLLVIGIAPSRVSPSGATKGYWRVRCDCGAEKEMQPRNLVDNKHASCGKGCKFTWGAVTEVTCVECAVTYNIQYRGKGKLQGNVCRACSAKKATLAVIGKPAPNRLPEGEAAFNSLYGAYMRNALNQRGVCFDLTKEIFRELTQKSCTYCGKEPSSIRDGDAFRSRGKASGYYTYNGIDRIDSSKGYAAGNVTTCCAECNRMKGAMPVGEFLSHIERISKFQTIRAPKSGNRVFFP